MPPEQTHLPRGIRNNNPGNLNFSHQPGALPEPGPHGRFAIFSTPYDGIQALQKQLILYYQRDNIRTISSLIAKWAPPVENDTIAYCHSVASSLHCTSDTLLAPFTPASLAALTNAIIHYENGQNPYGTLALQSAQELLDSPR